MYQQKYKKGETILVEYDQMAAEFKTIQYVYNKNNVMYYKFMHSDNDAICEEIDKISALYEEF
jgi:hypothetical protein